MTERYIPIDEANVISDRVRFHLPLPDYIERERIGVDLSRVERLCRFGGIRFLKVVGKLDGDVSSFTPEITGYNGSGEAVAANKGTKDLVPLYTTQSELGAQPSIPSFKFSLATLNINLNEAVNRAIHEQKGKENNVRDVETWTEYLDKSLRQGISQVGFDNLVRYGDKFSFAFATALSVILSASAMTATLPAQLDGFLLLKGFLLMHQLRNQLELTVGKILLGSDEGYRWSLISGIQLDRAFILRFLTSRESLVKALPKTTETSSAS